MEKATTSFSPEMVWDTQVKVQWGTWNHLIDWKIEKKALAYPFFDLFYKIKADSFQKFKGKVRRIGISFAFVVRLDRKRF